jgi:hypothetical protein
LNVGIRIGGKKKKKKKRRKEKEAYPITSQLVINGVLSIKSIYLIGQIMT